MYIYLYTYVVESAEKDHGSCKAVSFCKRALSISVLIFLLWCISTNSYCNDD